jgi:hypothetical protein
MDFEATGKTLSTTIACIVCCAGTTLSGLITPVTAQTSQAGDKGTIGPWLPSDTAQSKTLAEDRPDATSSELWRRYYSRVTPEKFVRGEKGLFNFRITPREPGWAGIRVLDAANNPLPATAKATLTDAEGTAVAGIKWNQWDNRFLFSDASPVLPQTRITVNYNGQSDGAVLDFRDWKYVKSHVQMGALLDGPTSRHGRVFSQNGQFVRDGKPMFFWGGHENHVPSKELSDQYAEIYAENGINIMRNIGLEEIVANPETGEIDPKQLDRYQYLIAKLGQRGIYFLLSGSGLGYLNGVYGFKKGEEPKDPHFAFWNNPKFRQALKHTFRQVLTTPNPYNKGIPLKDDPTVIGIELANESGLHERRYDFNRLDEPDATKEWRVAFNQFLLKKYGDRKSLAKAWAMNPLLPDEDPAKNTIVIPSNYRGARSPYGGTGQHDQFVTGRWYLPHGIPASANPRFVDAIEFNTKIAKKNYPFDFNDATKPQQTRQLREAFNAFLLQKYGGQGELSAAWAEDPLFPWEDATKNTILIPTNFRGQKSYDYKEHGPRIADPRISDMMEFTYEVQRNWATDLANFLHNEVGVKCAVGWNGDTFHVTQTPNHLANMMSPLDMAIAAAYLDWDDGDQITSRLKNLKRFTAYGRILGRPMFSYEWSFWNTQGPFSYEYALLAALMGRAYGFDGYSHHKMAPYKYPIQDPQYSLQQPRGSTLNYDYISPLSDRPRRGAFEIGQWIMQRSKIQEQTNRLIVGFPVQSTLTGGSERKMSNWPFENWLMYQIGVEDYAFKDVYDGPTDRVVIHSGWGPYGDYRKARHAILWCRTDSDRTGKDPKAKEKWFALHGIKFKPGQKYFVNDQFFATTEDLSDYNLVHEKAEKARWALLEANATKDPSQVVTTAAGDYWAAEPNYKPREVDRQIYHALQRWGYPLPFSENEIDKVWRSRDKSMVMDTNKLEFRAARDDMQLWFGKLADKKIEADKGGLHREKWHKVDLPLIEAITPEKQYSLGLLPWDTGDFKTARTLVVWTHWNSEVTIKLSLPGNTEIYAVNWLGQRIYRVRPIAANPHGLTFATVRDNDVFCYEVLR